MPTLAAHMLHELAFEDDVTACHLEIADDLLTDQDRAQGLMDRLGLRGGTEDALGPAKKLLIDVVALSPDRHAYAYITT